MGCSGFIASVAVSVASTVGVETLLVSVANSSALGCSTTAVLRPLPFEELLFELSMILISVWLVDGAVLLLSLVYSHSFRMRSITVAQY